MVEATRRHNGKRTRTSTEGQLVDGRLWSFSLNVIIVAIDGTGPARVHANILNSQLEYSAPFI